MATAEAAESGTVPVGPYSAIGVPHRLDMDVILLIASWLSPADLLRLRNSSRFLWHTLSDSRTLWRHIEVAVKDNSASDPKRFERDVSFLWKLLELSRGAQQEIRLRTFDLSLQQCEVLVDAVRLYSESVEILSVEKESPDGSRLWSDLAFFELPNLRHLRIVETIDDSYTFFLRVVGDEEDFRDNPKVPTTPLRHLESICYHIPDSYLLRSHSTVNSLLSTLADIDLCTHQHTISACMLRSLLDCSKGAARRVVLRTRVCVDPAEVPAHWQPLAVPLLKELHLGGIFEVSDDWGQVRRSRDLFESLSFPSLRLLSLECDPRLLQSFHCPDLRKLSHQCPHGLSHEMSILHEAILGFDQLRYLEIRCNEQVSDYEVLQHYVPCLSRLSDAMAGHPGRHRYSGEHSLALPYLEELWLRDVVCRSFYNDDDQAYSELFHSIWMIITARAQGVPEQFRELLLDRHGYAYAKSGEVFVDSAQTRKFKTVRSICVTASAQEDLLPSRKDMPQSLRMELARSKRNTPHYWIEDP